FVETRIFPFCHILLCGQTTHIGRNTFLFEFLPTWENHPTNSNLDPVLCDHTCTYLPINSLRDRNRASRFVADHGCLACLLQVTGKHLGGARSGAIHQNEKWPINERTLRLNLQRLRLVPTDFGSHLSLGGLEQTREGQQSLHCAAWAVAQINDDGVGGLGFLRKAFEKVITLMRKLANLEVSYPLFETIPVRCVLFPPLIKIIHC